MVLTLWNREISLYDDDVKNVISYPNGYDIHIYKFGYGMNITVTGGTPVSIVSNNICVIDRRDNHEK